MSDLISRSELIKHFEAVQSQECAIGLDFVAIIDEIKEQPTAYDVDKVVEELEKIEQHCLDMSDWQGQSAICDAIEIVKQGGGVDE